MAMRGEGRFTGTRGGKDQFDWDDVKVDADREQYLGHSLITPVGRWQKGECTRKRHTQLEQRALSFASR